MLREFVDFTCEECHRHEDIVGKLRPHRIKRGCQGGKYELRNIKMVCSECSKNYHYKEFSKF
jgi:ribosomal protein L33